MKISGLVAAFGLVFLGITSYAQSPDAEVPGDNFSLEGALELFKKSRSPEEFEKLLNSPDSKVNNLDLNRDNYIDYIRVIDRNRDDVHTFTMQAVLSENESQDVAVIELVKHRNGEATLQITGDADVYGMETIIEPTEEVRVNAGTTSVRNVVNVWSWPSVQYVYTPYYDPWVSPWYWAYRPVWWSPWRPVAYYVYDPWWRPYRPYYSVCHSRRNYYGYDIYRPYRTTSIIVHHHYGTQIDRYRSRYDRNDHAYGRDNHGRDRFEGRGYADSRDRNTNTSETGRTRGQYSSFDKTQSSRNGVGRNELNSQSADRTFTNPSSVERPSNDRVRKFTEPSWNTNESTNMNPRQSDAVYRTYRERVSESKTERSLNSSSPAEVQKFPKKRDEPGGERQIQRQQRLPEPSTNYSPPQRKSGSNNYRPTPQRENSQSFRNTQPVQRPVPQRSLETKGQSGGTSFGNTERRRSK